MREIQSFTTLEILEELRDRTEVYVYAVELPTNKNETEVILSCGPDLADSEELVHILHQFVTVEVPQQMREEGE